LASGEKWVGVDDVAAHLGVARDSIYRWVEKRRLPARKVGRLLRFKLSEVDAWVEAGGGDGDGSGDTPPTARKSRSRRTGRS